MKTVALLLLTLWPVANTYDGSLPLADFQAESGHELAGGVAANRRAFQESTETTLVNFGGLGQSVVGLVAGDDCATKSVFERGFFGHVLAHKFDATANVAADVNQFAGRITMLKVVAAQNVPSVHPARTVGLAFGGVRHFVFRDANLNVGVVIDKVDASRLSDSFQAEAKVHQGGGGLFGGHCVFLCDASFILVNSPVRNSYRPNSAKNSKNISALVATPYPPEISAAIDSFTAGFEARRAGLPRRDVGEQWATGWEMGGWSLTSGLKGLYGGKPTD
jgi:hypothetical protein